MADPRVLAVTPRDMTLIAHLGYPVREEPLRRTLELVRQTPGHVAVVAYASVNDIGRVVSPTIARGQVEGGAVQGIGQALMEHMVYDSGSGQPVSGTLMDYAAPRADAIACEFVTEMNETVPCKNNPLGVKGVGELGTIGAAPCVVNAVADALARAGKPQEAAQVQMPLTPAKVWEILAG